MRPDHDTLFIEFSYTISKRGTCPRLRVGAVIAKDGEIISTGYNGAPKGIPHCDDVGCIIRNNHCIRSAHAEANAVQFAGKRAKGATIYCTHFSCIFCAHAIINAGIFRAIYADEYVVDNVAVEFFELAGVEIVRPNLSS